MSRIVISVLILVLAASAAVAADIPLRYRMAKGETLRYDCTTTGTGVAKTLDHTDPITLSAEFAYVMTCTGVDKDGNMTVVNRVEDLKVAATMAGKPLPVNMQLPVLTTVMDTTGRVLSTKVEKAEPAGGDAGALLAGQLGGTTAGKPAFDLDQFFGDLHGPGFPVEAVHPGSRWQDVLKLTTQSGQTMDLTYTTTLLDYAQLTGHDCARLSTDYELPLELTLTAGYTFNLSGKTTGSQIAYFDYQRGRVLRFDGTSDTQITMALPQLFGSRGPAQQAASMTVRATTTVALRPE
jgi:hypothetical protein